MRTSVRSGNQRIDPARRPRRVLRVGGAAGRSALRGRPVIVGLGRGARGELRGEGVRVRTAMGAAAARRLCPHAMVVPPRMSAYARRARRCSVFSRTRTRRRGDLDRRGLPRRPRDGAERGLASGDRGAPAAGGARAGRPVDHGRGRADEVPRQGRERCREARRASRRAAGRRARLPPSARGGAALGGRSGHGRQAPWPGYHDGWRSRSNPKRPSWRCWGPRRDGTSTHWPTTSTRGRCNGGTGVARSARSAPGVGRPASHESVDADVVALVDRVTRRLRAARRVGRTVVLRLRFGDFTRATRSHTLPQATASTAEILAVARALLAASLPELERRGLTLVGISVANLEDASAVQLVLPFDRVDREALDAALDEVRDRFGSTAITRGVLVGRNPGITMPLLPDRAPRLLPGRAGSRPRSATPAGGRTRRTRAASGARPRSRS